MNYYSIALFLHIVGALGFFVALGLEWVSVQYLQRATTAEQVKERLAGSTGMRALGGISLLVILIAGFYMTATWGGVAWITVALGALIVLGVIGGVLTGPRMRAIKRGLNDENGPLSPTFQRVLHHPLLRASLQIRIAMALGIVFLMSVKPTLVASLIAMGVAILLGLVSLLPLMGRRQVQQHKVAA